MTASKPGRRSTNRIAIAVWALAMTLLWAATSAGAPYIYVLNRNSEDLSVIDLRNPTVELAVLDVRRPGMSSDVDANPRGLPPATRDFCALRTTPAPDALRVSPCKPSSRPHRLPERA
jgi:hypothetical protein